MRGIERSQLRADWHRYAVSRDHRRIIDARGRDRQLVGVGVGKRRWYATIFSFDRPRSRSISTERRGRFPSRAAGFTPRSSSPWPLPCRALVFTRASPCSSRPSLPFSRQCGAHIAFMAYLSSLTGMRRLAVAPSEWLGGAFASPPARGRRRLWPVALKRSPTIFGFFPRFFNANRHAEDRRTASGRSACTTPKALCGPGQAMGRGGGLVVPQSGSAVAEAQAVRVVPGLAGVAVGLPVPHRGAGGLKALGLGRRVQPRMQR